MARRSDHSREELLELMVSTGERLMAEEGLAKFSARKLAAEVGYTVGTVTHLFGSYDMLVLHITARTLDRWFEDLARTLATRRKPATFEDLALYYIDYAGEHYHAWMALFEHTLPADMPLPDWYTPKLRRFFELLEGMMLPYVGGNRRKARRAARVLWAGIHGICILSLSRKLDLVESESARVLAKAFVETYLRGLTAE